MTAHLLLWCFATVALGQGSKKPLSVADIEDLLKGSVRPRRVATLVEEQGVKFEVTAAIKERLRKAGADDGVIVAVEQASLAYARQQLEAERRKLEEDRKRKDSARTEAVKEETEEEVQRKAETKRQADEAKAQAKAEAARKKEEKRQAERQAEQERKREQEARSIPAGMVAVPGGEFFMGCNEQIDTECDDDEKPGRQVSVGAFQIDKTEVTVEAYGRCVDAGACSSDGLTMPFYSSDGKEPPKEQPEFAWTCNWGKSGREQHPINCLEWRQARAYCEWAGKRLPTEKEWEKAARGTDGRKYSWGNRGYGAAGLVANIGDETAKRSQPKWTVAEGYDDNYYNTAPVGSFPAGVSPYGALDMIGNVFEWTADWYDAEQKYRSVRGGSWYNLPRNARASNRGGYVPVKRYEARFSLRPVVGTAGC